MAKFNSSRSQKPRNPGPAGRARTFKGKSTPPPKFPGQDPKLPKKGRPSRDENPMRDPKPTRPEKSPRPSKSSPLAMLKGSDEDGVLHLPTVEFVDFEPPKQAAPVRKVREKKVSEKKLREKKVSEKKVSEKNVPEKRKIVAKKPAGDNPRAKFKSRPKSRVTAEPQPGERLQKVLALAGFGSRRDCEEYIVSGRVMVDREVVTELGTRVLPDQTIHLDGELVRTSQKKVYYALNKPTNVICTNDDPDGRRRALDFIREKVPGLFAVGRLDLHSEGLLLITNDGELANRLTHPRYKVPKVYRVRVSGTPTKDELAQICHGMYFTEGMMKADEVQLRHAYKDGTSVLEITLREGRNREIRRLLARLDHNVLDLVRISVGPVKLGRIPIGAYRSLTSVEVRELKKLVGLYEPRVEKSPKVDQPEKPAKSEKPAKPTQPVKPKRKVKPQEESDDE